MKDEVNEKERMITTLYQQLDLTQNEINMLSHKSQMMMREAKSETA